MVRRFFFAISLCVALMIGMAGLAHAQVGSTPNEEAKVKGYKLYQEEIDAYHLATADCSSPSLECLVKNTTRFVAIEWVMDIIGPTNTMGSGTEPALTPPVLTPSRPDMTPIAARSGGAIGGLYNMIGGMYAYQPANTSRYVADVMDNAGMVPPAYAQGLGFASLDPILSLWKSFRNLAYFFFIAILIVIGIMIMLRQKISAQASVSAQQALPGIIISLILVTFSYAIAGLLIDAMYLSMFLIAGLFNTITGGEELGTQMISMNIFQLGGLMFVGGVNTWNENGNAITQILSSAVGSSDSNPLVAGIGYGAGLTVTIVIAVAVLIGTVKLFIELLKSYASIIMAVVFSPIYLMIGALPGKNAFSPWLKNLVGNLAAFPVTLLFVLIFKIFTENLNTADGGGFMPPFLVGNGQSGIAGYVLGLAILLALPDIVKTVKKNMGAAEGGFGWAMAGAALASARQGAPIGLRVGGAAMAAPVGALGGFARGVWDNKGLYRAGMIKQALGGTFGTSGRYAGNYLNYGNNAGGALSGAMGGSTPGYLKPVETGFSTMTKSVTEQNRLKRMERAAYEETTLPQRILSLGALKTDQWSANVKLAELEKARKEAYHEELKKQMSIANPNQRDFKALRDIAQTSFKQ